MSSGKTFVEIVLYKVNEVKKTIIEFARGECNLTKKLA